MGDEAAHEDREPRDRYRCLEASLEHDCDEVPLHHSSISGGRARRRVRQCVAAGERPIGRTPAWTSRLLRACPFVDFGDESAGKR